MPNFVSRRLPEILERGDETAKGTLMKQAKKITGSRITATEIRKKIIYIFKEEIEIIYT